MFWADKIVEDITQRGLPDGDLIIRDEKTASGRIHVGSMRGVAIHGIISRILHSRGATNRFLYEINDFDPMDGLPTYLDTEVYAKYMGQPLYTIPSPDGKAKNYAEYFAEEFISVIHESGFAPQLYRASELYRSGRMNGVIEIALRKADVIRRIYKEVSGSVRAEDWFPLNVVCESCGKIGTTRVVSFDGERVSYVCEKNQVEWAQGCGHSGSISPYDGNAKLPWKVEWAAKFTVLGVSIEGAGKDHSTKGGSRDVANRISKEVFENDPPFDIPYEFFLVGGKKMSSSKGAGSGAREIADLLPPVLFRLALLGKDIKQAFNFEPDGDTIPTLYDTYDRLAQKYFSGVRDDQTRLFELLHPVDEPLVDRFLPRFTQIAFLVQMEHLDLYEEVAKIKGEALSDVERKEVDSRTRYAKNWLQLYAPEEYRFELKKEVPQGVAEFSPEQKTALGKIRAYIETEPAFDGEKLHAQLHQIKEECGISPGDLFGAIYVSFLGKRSGPKAGWFLSTLDKEFLERRLREVSM